MLLLVEQIPLFDKGSDRCGIDFHAEVEDKAFGEAVEGRDVPAGIAPDKGFVYRDLLARCAFLPIKGAVPCDGWPSRPSKRRHSGR